mmetsp:Transcript_11242/g.10866  ORF Transcript_11242/g.10866 Transcript_11242/m.10866 type:complete len:80 (-) Transcript_11242:1095-1334(-)
MADQQAQQQQLQQFRAELQNQMVQDLMNKMTDNCFKVCTGKRGENLDSTEKQCLNHCMDRYADTMNVVNQSLVNRQSRG